MALTNRQSLEPSPAFHEVWDRLHRQLTILQRETAEQLEPARVLKLREVQLEDLESSDTYWDILSLPEDVPAQPGPRPLGRVVRVVNAVLAFAAILILALGALLAFGHPGSLGGASHASSVSLSWRRVSLPSGVVLDSLGVQEIPTSQPPGKPHAWLTVVPEDGAIAYICQTLPGNLTHLWRTRDAGSHWAVLPTIQTTSALPVCYLHTDQNDPLTVLVTLSTLASDPAPTGSSFALLDGAAQWRPTSNFIGALASWKGTFFAIKGSADSSTHLDASTDLNTWHTIDSSTWKLLESGNQPAAAPRQLWVQPKTGAMEVFVGRTASQGQIWTSTDQGAHWRLVAFPWWMPIGGRNTLVLVYVQPPARESLFSICAAVDISLSVPQDQTTGGYSFYCSNDGGETWSPRVFQVSLAQGTQPLTVFPGASMSVYAILTDGSLIIWDVTTILRLPVDTKSVPVETVLGTIPTLPDPNNIPAGMIGITARGAVFWQAFNASVVYVAAYNP